MIVMGVGDVNDGLIRVEWAADARTSSKCEENPPPRASSQEVVQVLVSFASRKVS